MAAEGRHQIGYSAQDGINGLCVPGKLTLQLAKAGLLKGFVVHEDTAFGTENP